MGKIAKGIGGLAVGTIRTTRNCALMLATNVAAHHVERRASDEAKEAVKAIVDILMKAAAQVGLGTEPLKSLPSVLLCILKRANREQSKEWIKTLPDSSTIDTQMAEKHFEIGHFAMGAYAASMVKDTSRMLDVLGLDDPEDVICSFMDSTSSFEYCPMFVLLLDKSSASVVLAIRGTASFQDAMIDLVCDDEEFLDGFAHKGMLRSMKSMLSKLGDDLRNALEDHPGFALNITGHSLGAGIALLATMEILSKKTHYVPEDAVIQCIALAPPPIYRSDIPVPEEIESCLHIYINSTDCVPRASLATLTCLVAKLRAIDALELGPIEKVNVIVGKKDKDTRANQERIFAALESVKTDGQKFLDHPGKVNFVYKCRSLSTEDTEKGRQVVSKRRRHVIVRQGSGTFSKNFMVRGKMLKDHDLERYFQKLERAISRGRHCDFHQSTDTDGSEEEEEEEDSSSDSDDAVENDP